MQRKGPALALLCLAQFVDVLDINAVIVALPSIGEHLGFSSAGVQWVISAYILCFAGFLLLSGRMADLWGRRRNFVAGLAVFTAASLSCGLSVSPAMLVISRAVQGLGAAIMAPAALSIITTIFAEGQERDRAIAAWTAVAAGGGAAGLLIGGSITDALGWEWIFFVNVPLGLLGIALAYRFLPESRDPAAVRQLDLLGALTVTDGLVLLVFGLSRIERAGVTSLTTLATLSAAIGCLIAFVLIERRAPHPLIPLAIFRSRELTGSALVAFAITAASSPIGVLVTLYLQNRLGYSAATAGLIGLPFSIAVIAGSIVSERLTAHWNDRATMILGLIVIAAAGVVTAGITLDGQIGYALAGAAILGIGLGCASVASTARGTSAVDAGMRGLASGIMNTAAQIGTALGLAILVTLAASHSGSSPKAAGSDTDYRLAFLLAAAIATLGVSTVLMILRRNADPQQTAPTSPRRMAATTER